MPPIPDVTLTDNLPAITEHLESTRQSVLSDPLNAELNGRLGIVLATYDFFSPAEQSFLRAEAIDPKDFRWPYYRGTILAWSGKTTEAITAFNRVIHLHSKHIGAQTRLADQLLEQSQLAESQKMYRQILKRDPNQIVARYGLGRTLLRAGDITGAVTELEAALALSDQIKDIHYALAQAYRQQGDEPKAQKHLGAFNGDTTIALKAFDPVAIEFSELHAGDRPHMLRAKRYVAVGRYVEAIEALNAALIANPRNVLAHTHLVWIYGLWGQRDEAAFSYRKGLEIDQHTAQLHINWGDIERRGGRFPEAAQAYKHALDLDSTNANTHTQLGFVLAQQGRLELAEKHYEQALAIDPGNRDAHALLARTLTLRRKHTDAARHLEQAIEPEDERTPQFLRALAGVYTNMEQYPKALDSLQRAQRLVLSTANTNLAKHIEDDLHRVTALLPSKSSRKP